MAAITMWTHGARRCVYGEDAPSTLRLFDATGIIREQIVGPSAAEILAGFWKNAEEDTPSSPLHHAIVDVPW